jgi:hypothetical protein
VHQKAHIYFLKKVLFEQSIKKNTFQILDMQEDLK